jgi:hypothetical protein
MVRRGALGRRENYGEIKKKTIKRNDLKLKRS